MFAKLLKYELKSIGKWYFALNASVLAISLFLGFSFSHKPIINYANNSYNSGSHLGTQLLPLSLALIFGILVAGAWIATLVIIVRRFYKSIFGREGYLSLTLPVSTHQLILSKLLAAFIWSAFNTLILGVGVILLLLPISGVGNFLVSISHITSLLKGSEWLLFSIYLIFSEFCGTLLIYLAISIGQLFNDKRVLFGFLAYFVLTIILFISSGLLKDKWLDDGGTSPRYFIYCIGEFIFHIIVCYYATYYIIKNKLNIQ